VFVIGPAYVFLIANRLPMGLMRQGAAPWISSMLNNVALAAFAGGMMWLVGVLPFLMIHLPIVLMAIAPTNLLLGTRVGTMAERTGVPRAMKIPEMNDPTIAHRMVM
jgi:fatty acid desaturase